MSLLKRFSKTKPICKVTFSLPEQAASGAKKVKIVGDFNNWQVGAGIPMKKRNGNYRATLELATDQDYEFRYLLDDELWENDWEADDYQGNPYGEDNSIVKTHIKN